MRLKPLSLLVAACLAAPAALHATTYTTTNSFSVVQVSLTAVPNSGGLLTDTRLNATNTSGQTLSNLYFFTTDVNANGTALTLTSPGDYTAGALFADATNAAVFINPSQVNTSVDARSSGDPSVPYIPGFLVANTLAPGQTVFFDIDFEVPSTSYSLSFNAIKATAVPAATTPEPSSFVLLATGTLASATALRRRFKLVRP